MYFAVLTWAYSVETPNAQLPGRINDNEQIGIIEVGTRLVYVLFKMWTQINYYKIFRMRVEQCRNRVLFPGC